MNLRLVLLFILPLILVLPLVSAELKIEKKAIIDTVIPEINQPAKYLLKITNLGNNDMFEIYSLVGVNIKPNETFYIKSGETIELEIELWPEQTILENLDTLNFVYKIKGEKSGIQEDVLAIKITNLKNIFGINSYNINLESDKIIVYVKNRVAVNFDEINARFYSAFFDFSKKFSLLGYEKREFEVALDKEKIKNLTAGQHLIEIEIETLNKKETIKNYFEFTEKADISTSEKKSGFIISTSAVEKINQGNLPFVVQTIMRKNIISRLFTTFNIEPVKIERKGFSVAYTFQKEINPSEVFKVKATTNWLYPLILLIALIIIIFLVKSYTSSYLILRKRATFVKTKGGEFALKITLITRAKKFVEKIKIIDKIPALVKVYERFGTAEPEKIDEKNKRLEWQIDSLQPDEERIFSYIIYSRMAPVGKFELPTATAVFETDNKIHETESNRVFFLTEVRKVRKEE